MNLENLFEFDASNKDSRYQGYMRRVAKIAQQNFPGSATPEEAMALLLLKKEEENAKKIDTVDKINDQQERRVSALQRTNRSLERELENITGRLDKEQVAAAGRGVPRELEQKIDAVLQQQDQAIAADKADIEKLEQQMKNLAGLQMGRTGTEDQRRMDQLTQQIEKLEKQPRDPKIEREIELKTRQLEKLQQELAVGQEQVGRAGKDVSARLQSLGQQQQELEKQQQELIRQQQELEKATQERIKKAAIAAGRRGTPADYKLSKKRLDALEPKVNGIEEKLPVMFDYVNLISDAEEDQWAVIKNNSKSIEDLTKVSNQLASTLQPRANLGESENVNKVLSHIQTLTEPIADYIEKNYPNEVWLKKIGRGSLELEIQKKLYKEYLRTNDPNVLRDENKIKAVIQVVVATLKKRWDSDAVGQDPRQGNLFDQPTGNDTPNDPQGRLFERPSLKDRLKEATEQALASKPKTSLDESLLDLFQARLLKSSAGSNGEVPKLDYQGHAVPDELSSEESPVVDLEVQMQDPDSPGAQGLQNLGQPWDRQKSFVLPKNDLDQNLREERLQGRVKKKARRPQAREDLPRVEPGQASPVISYDRQMEDPISPGARGDYNWGRPHHQFKHREDVRESITLEVDEDITEVYEATKSTKTRNPVARAAQRVARGSGRHGTKKDYQRQPKHRGRSQ